MRKRRSITILLVAFIVLLLSKRNLTPQQLATVEYEYNNKLSAPCATFATTTTSDRSSNATTMLSSFNIVILSSHGVSSLQRLGTALDSTNYHKHHTINLWIHCIDNNASVEFEDAYKWSQTLKTATTSFHTIHVSKNDLQSELSWLNDTWKPSPLEDEIGIILTDDVRLSKLWYNWSINMYKLYNAHGRQNVNDIGGFSLERRSSILQNVPTEVKPFLYNA